VNTFVIDASIAIKWVVEEEGTREALVLYRRAKLIAPELLVPECANILWKKTQRNELSKQEALLAAGLLQHAELELLPTRSLLETATRIAIDLDHPAYDCLYLGLAVANECRFVTSDERFLRKLGQARSGNLLDRAISLKKAAAGTA
jgi:predicted nucleic acid-binding protein